MWDPNLGLISTEEAQGQLLAYPLKPIRIRYQVFITSFVLNSYFT